MNTGPFALAWGLAVALVATGASAQATLDPEARVAARAGERVLDEVAGTLELEPSDGPPVVVYASELRLMVRLQFVRGGADNALRTAPHPLVSAGVLSDLLAERLVARQAERRGAMPPTRPEVEAEVREILRWPSPRITTTPEELFRAAQASRQTLFELMRVRLAARSFVRAFQQRLLEPSDTEIRAAFDAGRFAPYAQGATSFAQARGELRARLIKDAVPRAIRSLFRSMSARGRVRTWRISF